MKTAFILLKVNPLVFIFGIIFTFGVSAQQAKKISLQGFLKDANGKAIADGQQNITFKLYAQEVGGNAAWTEDQTVNVFGGIYSTHLGKTVSLENLNWGASTYYVGVTLQGVELTPRTELTFAPYSLGSPKAQEVVCSGAVGDIKHSILNPTQFAAVNGSCWVPMDGRALATTDKLRQITGMTSVPNGGGLFIRSQEFESSFNYDFDRNYQSPIAQVQVEGLKKHQHALDVQTTTTDSYANDPIVYSSFKYIYDVWSGYASNRPSNTNPNAFEDGLGALDRFLYVNTVDLSGKHRHDITVSGNTDFTGGEDTRPNNMNFWVYIRIN